MEKRHILWLTVGERFEVLCTPHCEHSDPIYGTKIRMTGSLLNYAKNTQAIPGISSALYVPMTHVSKE